MLMFGSLIGDAIGLVLTVCVILICYFKWTYQYWARKNVPFLEPSIPYGNFTPAMTGKEHDGLTIKRIYDEMKAKGWKHGGCYMLLTKNIMFLDLDLMKNILTKDFNYFTDRISYYNDKDDPLSAHLAFLDGARWRNLRTKMSPTFTSGKMKMMFQSLMECEVSLQKKLEEESLKKAPTDIKEVMARFNTDVIASCAFGLECKTLEDENSPFRVHKKQSTKAAKIQKFILLFAINFPNLSRLLHIRITPKETEQFYTKLIRDTVEFRENNNYRRNDFMQMLIDMKNDQLVDDDDKRCEGLTLTFNELAAQAFVFFVAGFETSSTLMSFVLYEIGKHLDIQEKLREEIHRVLAKHDGKITYDAIQEMKYFSQVLDETLRLYPPGPKINRLCVKNYRVPELDLVIEKGTAVLIPILAIHHDPEYYPDPEKFDPDRFSEENKKSRHQYTFLPFGGGPRICIGMRFALMQAKVGLASLLRNFKVTVNNKTSEPLKMIPHSQIFAVEGGIWLDIHKI